MTRRPAGGELMVIPEGPLRGPFPMVDSDQSVTDLAPGS